MRTALQLLLDELLWDIYGKVSLRQKEEDTAKRRCIYSWDAVEHICPHSWKYPFDVLQGQSIESLTQICASLRFEIRIIGSYLTRVLIKRDRKQRRQEMLCDVVTACLQALSDKSERNLRERMEALTGQQVSAGQAMERMLTNFYKDSKSRKTGRYYENRLKKLEAEWSDFVRRDGELQKFRATNMEHPYFREAYFLQAQEVYEDLKGELKDGANELEEAHSIGGTMLDGTNLPKPNGVDVAKRVAKQQSLIGSLKKAIENVNQLLMDQPDRSLAFCQQHVATLTNYWTTISEAHHELVAETTECNSDAEITSLENAYQEVMIRLMETTAKSGSGSSETFQSNIKLPTVTIPTFSGDYLKWSSFAELFKQMIGNTTLPKIQKMFYLKTNLTGEAGRLIAHLPVSEENYQAAWDILCNRYDNQRLIVSAFLNSLLSIPCVTLESPSYLKRMHDTVRESLFGIKNLGIDTANWDPLIVHLLLRKIDKETHRLFEQSLQDPRQVPKLDTLLSFVESRFQLLEGFGEEKS